MNEDLSVRDAMNREYVGVSESDGLVETAELLLREDEDTAVVLRGSEPVGVLTCRDVLGLVVDGPVPDDATVGDAMTPSLPTVSPDVSLGAATDEMSAQDTRRLVVTRGSGEEPVGILTEHDVLATRPFGRAGEPGQREDRSEPVDAQGPAMAEATMDASGSESFEDQSICEGCGTLTSDLSSFNGQLLCADCRDI